MRVALLLRDGRHSRGEESDADDGNDSGLNETQRFTPYHCGGAKRHASDHPCGRPRAITHPGATLPGE
jgi:hypothetical protein